jgi:PIN domain nuclease of toxin-antitoxin system
MRLLLDTQVFLWFLDDSARMPAGQRAVLEDPGHAIFVSPVSVWEIAIKASLGRLDIEEQDVARLPQLIDAAGFDELPVSARHAAAVHALPPHHRDPFDRLLIAQARAESLTVVTSDPAFRAYEVALL